MQNDGCPGTLVTFWNRLLRVVREREARHIDANRIVPVNVRIICGTNCDLSQIVIQNKSRKTCTALKALSINLSRQDHP